MPKLPKFKTEDELADFVDTYDTASYWDDMATVDATAFRVKRRRQTAVRVPMSQTELKRLKKLAVQRGESLDEMLREWLSQRLKQEQRAA